MRLLGNGFLPQIGGAGWIRLIEDEYSDTVAAGAVNNTLATDGVNTRTATDGNSKMSIGSGLASFATGGAAAGNPGVWYPIQTRTAGLVFIAQLNQSSAGLVAGFDSNQSGALNDALILNGTSLQVISNGTTITIGSISLSTDYIVHIVLRATGLHAFIKGGAFTYPTLSYIGSAGNSNEYPGVGALNTTSVGSADYIRVAGYWLPVPLVSDGFSSNGSSDGLGHAETSGLGSGGSGVAWSGTTWSVSGGKAINTPVLGSELVVNGGFSTDTDWTKGTGWTISGGVAVATSVSGFDLSQTTTTIGKWYRMAYSATLSAGQSRPILGGVGGSISSNTSVIMTARATSSSVAVRGQSSMTGTIDNVTVKELLLKDLLSLHTSAIPDVFSGIDITVVADTQAGLALNWDSSSSPANGVIAYHDGTNCKLEKCVAGTWTTVVSAAATYSANARPIVSKIGTAYRLYYNNALVGSGTISDSGIINNTLHGRFNTYEGNTLDNYTCYASGTGGEYAVLSTI